VFYYIYDKATKIVIAVIQSTRGKPRASGDDVEVTDCDYGLIFDESLANYRPKNDTVNTRTNS